MDDRRASTFEALETFIQNQRMLLEQTQEDIVKLRKLKSSVLSKPSVDPEDLIKQIHEVGYVHDPSHYQLRMPKEIDWEVLNCCDPAPMHAFMSSLQEIYAKRAKPSTTQTSPLSDLQILVRQSKKTIIEPALERCAAYIKRFFPDDEDEGEESGAGKKRKEDWRIEIEREREKEKIRQLKKRKIHAWLSLPGAGGAAVFVRRDVEDESAEVDVVAAEDGSGIVKRARSITKKQDEEVDIDLDDDVSIPGGEGPKSKTRPFRVRRATTKQQQRNEENTSTQHRKRRQSTSVSTVTPTPAPPSVVGDADSQMDMDIDNDESRPLPLEGGGTANQAGNGKRGRNKPRSETYKQAWSESEQNLLEQLLEKIPDGEKNRWQKISRAMNGRRTPRQVASRVQKYFEKLKKFGIDVSKAHGRGGI